MIVATTAGDLRIDVAAPGRLLLRWWFPKAATAHCALQARVLAASWAGLATRGVDVVGLSYDDLADLSAWATDLGLTFPLAHADVDTADALGAGREQADPWRHALPRRVFDLVDSRGAVLVREVVHDAHEFSAQVIRALEGIDRP